jgi:arylmalonate decarboxylase
VAGDGLTVDSRRQFVKVTTAAALSAATGSPAKPVVGLIFPSSSHPVPPEATALYPNGVRFLSEGIGRGRTLPEDFDGLIERAIPVAEKLSTEGAVVIVLMAPPISFFKAAAFNQHLSDEITRAIGVPSITATTAIVEGLKAVHARRVVVATSSNRASKS